MRAGAGLRQGNASARVQCASFGRVCVRVRPVQEGRTPVVHVVGSAQSGRGRTLWPCVLPGCLLGFEGQVGRKGCGALRDTSAWDVRGLSSRSLGWGDRVAPPRPMGARTGVGRYVRLKSAWNVWSQESIETLATLKRCVWLLGRCVTRTEPGFRDCLPSECTGGGTLWVRGSHAQGWVLWHG